MKLYWSPRSPFVRKVMVCAHELGIADRLEKIYTLVSVTGVNADMLRVNPLGRIPALVTDEGGVLYDSIVICEFLDTRDGKHRLFPANGVARWDALRRHALADGLLEMLVLWRSLRNPGAGAPSPGLLDAFRTKVVSALAAAESEGLDPARFDIGDVTLGVVLGYLDFRHPEMDWRREHTQLADWFRAVASRPSMQQSAPEDELERTRST
jgi:glutathione S-transferase